MDRDLTDIARRGLDAASALVDRFSDAMDDLTRSPGGIEAVGQAWGEVIRTTAAAWSGDGSAGRSESGRVDVGTAGGVVIEVRLSAGESDVGEGEGELWVHNPTADPVPVVRVVSGPLRDAAGEVPGAAVTVDPVEVRPLAARSSHGLAVRVSVPAPVAGARLRSLLLVDGLPDVWAVLEVTVT